MLLSFVFLNSQIIRVRSSPDRKIPFYSGDSASGVHAFDAIVPAWLGASCSSPEPLPAASHAASTIHGCVCLSF